MAGFISGGNHPVRKVAWPTTNEPPIGAFKPVPVVRRPFEERGGQFSPDGRWVAYHSNESGRFEVYVQPFPGPGGKWQASTDGGVTPRWRRDGKEMYYIALDGKLMAAPIQASGSTFEASVPMPLFQTPISSGPSARYAVSADGRFLINVPTDKVPSPITLILNWHPEPGK